MSVKMSHILGMNARNHKFTSIYNKGGGKKIAKSKLLTKSTLRKVKIPTPRLYKVFRDEGEIEKYDYSKLDESFVVKPNRGLGGEGIIVIEKKGRKEGEWITTRGNVVSAQDLKLHIGDILEGRFSMNNLPDIAFVEERVRVHPAFEKYAYEGTPDIGVIIFNRVPVMAMLRIPTKESGGRANLFQGAVGAGIDMASGVTTYAIQYSEEVIFMPDARRKIRGIPIPEWEKVLKIAVECADAAGLGFMRADIVLQPSVKKPGETLPKVLELNSQPGLKIQLCNQAGLLRRLERVEDLEVESPEKGIRIAKELFGDKELSHLGEKTIAIKVFEEVEVEEFSGERHVVKAKVDTGAYRTSIDEKLAIELGLMADENVLMVKQYESALGVSKRKVVGITYYLGGRKVETTASVADRSSLKRPMIVGRKDLKGFVVEF